MRFTNGAEVRDCFQMNTDAADLDLTTAYYLEQIHYATNGTAWMIKNPDEDSFFILRTQDSISLVPNDEMSLIPFPTRELFEQQLPSFDLIILQDFEYLPYGIGDYLENIRSYVEGGGGLAMLGGAASFTSGGYYGTPVAQASLSMFTESGVTTMRSATAR